MKHAQHQLFYGDNLDVLRRKIKDETVHLCYIDPPFNSKRNYNQIYNNIGTEDRAQAQAFTDTWTWDDHARSGYDEIIANDQGRFQAQLDERFLGSNHKPAHPRIKRKSAKQAVREAFAAVN